MKIEVWSDYICPYCYIGKRSLEYAIEEFAHKDNIIIEYKSYELDANTMEITERTMNDFLAKKYNLTLDEIKSLNEKMDIQAKEVGLHYAFDKIKHTNSFDAHRLTRLAFKEGKGNDIVEHLFTSHFIEGGSINDHSNLLEIAKRSGLSTEKVSSLLGSCKYTSDVRDDEEQAVEMGVEGVPFYVFNETYALTGAQPVSVIKEVLQQVWEEETQQDMKDLTPKGGQTSYCTDEGCFINKE